MVTKLIQLAAVLAVTLFLASGCASTMSTPEGPFDFSVMREMEDAGQMFSRMTSLVPMSENARNQYDLAWTKYHAGQVAVAQGHYEEAKAYFDAAMAGIVEAMTTLQIEAMMSPTAIDPRLSF